MTRIALAAMAAMLIIAGCGDGGGGETAEPEPIAGSFVGTVEGTGAYVAVVTGRDGSLQAYVTDGGESVDFLDGVLEARDDTGARLGNDGGAVLEVSFAGTRASGDFTRPDEPTLSFTAEAAEAPAGLYQARESFPDGDYVAGWIVLPDGSQRGAIRRYETPLPPGSVDPTTFSASDSTFTVPGGVLRPRRIDPADDF